MQAVILAAGMGKRLGALTSGNTKCMVKVLGATLVERFARQLMELGIRRQVYVIGYRGDLLRSFLLETFRGQDVTFEFVENPLYDRTNNIYSLYLAREQLLRDDTILLESDLVFDDALLEGLLRHPKPDVAAVAPYESWMSGTAVTLDASGKVTGFVGRKQFRFENSRGYYKTVNAYKFSRDFLERHYLPFLEAYSRSQGRNEYYEEVLRVIAFLDRTELSAHVVDRSVRWYEIDDAQDLENAEALFATGRDKVERMDARQGGYWRFPGLLDFRAPGNPFFPCQGLLDEMTWYFRDVATRLPSGQAANAALAGKLVGAPAERAVAGNGLSEILRACIQVLEGSLAVALPASAELSADALTESVRRLVPPGDRPGWDVPSLLAAAEGSGHLLLANPCCGTGAFLDGHQVRTLVAGLEARGCRLLLDESLLDFHDAGPRPTLLDDAFLDAHPSVVLLRSVACSHGLAGLRLGLAVSSDTLLIRRIADALPAWNVNALSEFFLQVFEKYRGEHQASCRAVARERARVASLLGGIPGLEVLPSQANLVACRLGDGLSAHDLEASLLEEESILVQRIERDLVRFAVRSPEENDRLVGALRRTRATPVRN